MFSELVQICFLGGASVAAAESSDADVLGANEGLVWLNTGTLIFESTRIRFVGGASVATGKSSEILSVSVCAVLLLNFSCKYFSFNSGIIIIIIV